MNQAELDAVLPEVQIGALQAYATLMEELVAAMLVARLAATRADALEQKRGEQPELVDEAMTQRAWADARQYDEEVRALFQKGAPLRLTCAKVGAMPPQMPIAQIPDAPGPLQ
jgi:hypothetical protein